MTPKRCVFLLVLALAVASPAAAQSRGGHGGHGGGVSHGVAVARPVAVPRGSVAVSHGYYGGYHYGSYYYRPYYPYYYRPYAYPYYSFVPHFSIGVGISVGYPVAWPSYSYAYPYPYAYAYPYPYPYSGYYYPSYPPPAPAPAPPANYSYGGSAPYPSSGYSSGYPAARTQPYNVPSNSVSVDPASHSNSGGVSFEIEPATASVFVDGKYMGSGADFGATTQPLSLATGRHRVEIRAEGYQSVTFDADVTAGQVTPYKASLERR